LDCDAIVHLLSPVYIPKKEMMIGTSLLGPLALLLLSMYFKWTEAVLASGVFPSSESESTGSKFFRILFSKPGYWKLSGQTGFVIALLFFAWMLLAWSNRQGAPLMLTGAGAVAVVLMLVPLELLTKTCVKHLSQGTLQVVIIPFAMLHGLLVPVWYLFSLLTGELKALNLHPQEQKHPKMNSELTLEKRLFQNAQEFKSVRVYECMIPRTEITAVDVQDGLEKLHQAFVESGHSKIIVYRETIDDVIGYCHSSALFRKPTTIESILTPILTVSESMLARELLARLISERKSLAIVADEFGGISGMVSMEDVIEEIFGEIEDEHDVDDLVEQQLDAGTWLLSARLEIDYLNETYGWNLPTGDYETLGGLLLAQTEDIPDPGDVIHLPPFTLLVQSTLDNRIDTVKLTLEAPGTDSK
jgi:CBS domain containing-hemolysin-like protein